MNTLHSQKGATLIIALIFLVVMMLIGVAVVSNSATQLQVSINTEELMKIFHATNAGVNRAFDQTMVREELADADYPDDILLQYLKMDLEDITSNSDIGLTANEYGEDIKLHLRRWAMGAPCPRADDVDGGSSLNKISCDYFNIEGSAPNNVSDTNPPRVSVNAWREMIFMNSATHRSIDLSD
jgi:hypothetical protein